MPFRLTQIGFVLSATMIAACSTPQTESMQLSPTEIERLSQRMADPLTDVQERVRGSYSVLEAIENSDAPALVTDATIQNLSRAVRDPIVSLAACRSLVGIGPRAKVAIPDIRNAIEALERPGEAGFQMAPSEPLAQRLRVCLAAIEGA